MTRASVFDALAGDYDKAFSQRAPAAWMRQRLRERATLFLPDSGRVLDVGCGTGDDAIWFAEQGYEVIATDVSERMLDETRAKVGASPTEIQNRISAMHFDAAAEPTPAADPDVIWSNFGALNCVADLGPFIASAAEKLQPGGMLVLVLMGRFCLWETVGFALRGDFAKARRRWSGHAVYSNAGGDQDVWFHSPSAVRELASNSSFCVVDFRGCGVFMPSTEFFGACERRPWLFRLCARLESGLAGLWPFRGMGDHYVFIMRATGA